MKNLIKRPNFVLHIDKNTRVIKAIWYAPAIFTPVYKLQRMSSDGAWVTKAWSYISVLKKLTDENKVKWLLWAEIRGL